jgi:hypothetical protein
VDGITGEEDQKRDEKAPICCDMHGRNCEPPSELCCRDCSEAAHDTFPIRHADGSACSAPGAAQGGFERMLADPYEQFDQRGELLKSVIEYANAEPAAASGQASSRDHLTAVVLSVADIEKIKEAAYRAGLEDAAREAVDLLADMVVKCTEYGTQDGDFVASYLLPTGPVHRAIPWLDQRGINVRPGFDGRTQR